MKKIYCKDCKYFVPDKGESNFCVHPILSEIDFTKILPVRLPSLNESIPCCIGCRKKYKWWKIWA